MIGVQKEGTNIMEGALVASDSDLQSPATHKQLK